MKSRSLLLLTILLVLSVLVSASGSAATEAPATEAAVAYEGNYVLVPKNLGNPYFDTANNGAQEAVSSPRIRNLLKTTRLAFWTSRVDSCRGAVRTLMSQK